MIALRGRNEAGEYIKLRSHELQKHDHRPRSTRDLQRIKGRNVEGGRSLRGRVLKGKHTQRRNVDVSNCQERAKRSLGCEDLTTRS